MKDKYISSDDSDLLASAEFLEGCRAMTESEEKAYWRKREKEKCLANALDAFGRKDWMAGLRLAEKTNMKDARIQYYMGCFYEDGFSLERNPHMAAEWYEKAAEQGHEEAKRRLDRMHRNGYNISFAEESDRVDKKQGRNVPRSEDIAAQPNTTDVEKLEDIINGKDGKCHRRVKTGSWLPVRMSWMPQAFWDAVRYIHQIRTKAMSSGWRKAALGDKIFGKEGPEHEGYGTGALQKWADKMVKEGKNPYEVNLLEWFKGAVDALDYHVGEGTFDEMMENQKTNPDSFMRYTIERMQDYMPELRRMSRARIKEAIKQKYYTIRYAPYGILGMRA